MDLFMFYAFLSVLTHFDALIQHFVLFWLYRAFLQLFLTQSFGQDLFMHLHVREKFIEHTTTCLVLVKAQ